MAKKKISIYGYIGGSGLEPPDIRIQLDEASGEDIIVEINSPGGYVYDGLEMYHLFKNYSGHVHFHIVALAASMASFIPLSGNRVTAEQATVWMLHNPSGGIFGADYIEAAKFAAYMESMSKMFVRVYATKTGKSEKAIKEIMDNETFFFGKEALEFGLVDEIIDGENNPDLENREDAVANAQLQVEECINKMKAEGKKDNVEKIAAFFNVKNIKNVSTPAAAGKNKLEVKPMTLAQMMADNPAIAIEVEAMKSVSYTAGLTAGKEEISKKIEMASKYFSSEYPDKIKNIAAEAILGTKGIETLEAVIAVHDMAVEQNNLENANVEHPPNTPAQSPTGMAVSGIASTEDDVVAMAEKDKGGA